MHQVETGLAGIIRNKIADSEGGWIPFRILWRWPYTIRSMDII